MSESDVPQVFTADYYNSEYFAGEGGGKRFKRPTGIDKWSYFNESGESIGTLDIAKAWKTMFNPKTALDIGCGRGTTVAYMRDAGIEAEGFDWSKWAVTEAPIFKDGKRHWKRGGKYERCRQEWVWRQDATETPWKKDGLPLPDKHYDLVTAIDLYEHIYSQDIDRVAAEIDRVAKEWIFLEIATVDGVREKGYVLRKGEPHPDILEPNMVAGHVAVCTCEFWIDKFSAYEWELRRDMREWFVSLVPENAIHNWLLNTILIFRKI